MAPIYSILANRKDKANQPFWTEYRVPAVDRCCPAQPGAIVLLGPDCKIDPCLMPPIPSGLVIEINGVPSPCQDVLNFIPGTGISITYSPDCGYIFTATGTPTECGNAAFLCTDIATKVEVDLSHPTHPGQLLISQPGNASALWMDPQVQGLYAAGSTICPAPAYVPPTCIQPILIGGADCNGVLQNVSVTTGGELVVVAQDQETDINVLRFGATTGAALKTNATAALVPLLSIRPKVAATAVTFTLRNSDFLSGGNLSHYQILLNATLTGPTSFSNVDTASSMTFDVASTGFTGGRLIDSGFVGADHERHDYEMHFGFTGGTPDTITLVYVGAVSTGTPKSIAGCSFAWDEQSTCL
jgi:hypothetical protein